MIRPIIRILIRPVIRSVLGLEQRWFTTLDPVLNENYLMQSAVVAAGDFSYSLDFVYTDIGADIEGLLADDGTAERLFVFGSTSTLPNSVELTGQEFAGALAGLIEGALYTLKLVRISGIIELFISGVSKGTIARATSVTFSVIGRGQSVGFRQFSNIIANVNLGNGNAWNLDKPIAENTEQASGGSNVLTRVNVVADDLEYYTLNPEGTQWNGADGGTLVIA